MGKVRKKNAIRRNLILRALLDYGELSLTDLKNKTGITVPVVMKIVNSLKQENLVEDVVNRLPSQAGRPPSLVKLNGKAGYVLGVDIGRTYINIILLDLAQNIIEDIRKESIQLSNERSVVDALFQEINTVVQASEVTWDQILGIGISIPGIVQGPLGCSETYFNFGEQSTKDVLQEAFSKPVHIEHDAKAKALGELWFGAAKNRNNVLCINVGWGLGLGIIINGRLYYGSSYHAGEFGHLCVIPDGNLCYCGKRGCLETYASGDAIARNARDKIKMGAKTIIRTNETINLDEIDARTVIEAAHNGDFFSIEIIEEAARYLGIGIAQLINVFDPGLVIFGGRITMAENLILNPIVSAVRKYSLSKLNENVEFVISKLGPRAGALGVAMLASKDIFEVEHLNPTAYV